jgi:N-acetylmuramoyl-L-alanine amidase
LKKRTSPNFDHRPVDVSIDMLVFHYTGMQTALLALDRMCDPASEVSAHYMGDEDGSICSLVEEADRAWHAGVASWRGNTNINARSIGIEIVNPGHQFGYCAFSGAQMESVIELSLVVLSQNLISPQNVVGHSDIAPMRKIDPGEFFDWERLAGLGIGLWPSQADHLEQDLNALASALTRIGYDVSNFSMALKAFQRHYRPKRVTGRIDSETARLIIGLSQIIE